MPTTPKPPTVPCPACGGDGVVEYLIQSSRYSDSPDYREGECEDCGGSGAVSCEWCGEPALVECSVGDTTACSWTCKALVSDGPAKVGREVDEYRRLVASAEVHKAEQYLAAVAGRLP